MIQNFDYFNRAEIPNVSLCNPQGSFLHSLNAGYDKNLKIVYNGLSEFSMTFPETINGVIVPVYSLIESKRLIHIENIGFFKIENPYETIENNIKIKKIIAYSREDELSYKKINGLNGTFRFYNPLNPSDTTTILGKVARLMPLWSIGNIDSTLWDKYRTFKEVDNTVYNFLMSDIETAYGCIFIFDTENRIINALSKDNATTPTDIFMSFNNLINGAKLKTISEEITTCLHVFGAGMLDIRTVNPMGTDSIYNFDYYKTTQWMSQELIDALNNWENFYNAAQPFYSAILLELRTINNLIVELRSELAQLKIEYATLEGVVKVRLEQFGTVSPSEMAALRAKEAEISVKQGEIDSQTIYLGQKYFELQAYNETLSFSNRAFFSVEKEQELNNFIIENTYQNENFIQTDSMTEIEIQDMAQSLYDQAIGVLEKVSQPRYEFEIDSVNFIVLPEYQKFTSQLQLGCVVNIALDEDRIIETILLAIDIPYDNPTSLKLTFSNRLRLDNGKYVYGDLFGEAIKSATRTNFESALWSNWDDNYKDDVSTFIESALDASKNNIINATNQEIIIGQNGLRGRRFDVDLNDFDTRQVWLTSNTLAFTRDNWNTASAALGEITINGTSRYGLVAEAIVGRLIAGNQLTITNSSNTFTVNANGATLTNASLTVQNNTSAIILSPSSTTVNGLQVQGFAIQSNTGGSWRNRLYIDTDGNVVFSGTLSAASGSFTGSITANSGLLGGWTISSNGISDTYGNYIRSNGQIKLGAMTINGTTTTFNGTVSASNITGVLDDEQIPSLNAGKITTGTMSGNRIYAGRISGPGTEIDLSGTGLTRITASNGIEIWGAGNGLSIDGDHFALTGGGALIGGTGNQVIIRGDRGLYVYGNISASGNLSIGSITCDASNLYFGGRTIGYSVETPYGTRVLTFTRGILTNYT